MSNTTRVTVEELIISLQNFGIIDYLIFIVMLVLCAFIGVFFAYRQKQKFKKLERRRGSMEADYLVGGRKMKVFPIAMSLISSWISGVALLGIPTEIYMYGTEFMLIVGSMIVCGVISHWIFLPVFIDLKLTSTYEYLEERFDRRLRLFGSIIFTIATMIKMPIVIYVPALAFNQVTGIDIHIITPIVCIICIFYTCIGGIKAVVWTDVIQTVIMYITITLIIVKATIDLGGVDVLIERNMKGERLEFPPMTLDPTIRHSVLSILLGGGLFYTQLSTISQCMVQRFLSLPNLRTARQALWIMVVGVGLILFMCCVIGLLVFAMYHDCDPLTTKLAKAKDQLAPLLVMDVFNSIPAIPGIFIAGVFSATLSSLSTGLNSLAAITLEDFVKPNLKNGLTESQTSHILKGVVVLYGVLAVALVYIVEHLGGVLHLAMSMSGSTGGPLFAVFIMGLMIPRINANCALVGGVSGLLVMGWITANAQSALAGGQIKFATKPFSVEGCEYEFGLAQGFLNGTANALTQDGDEHSSLYHLSYLYYTLFGMVVTMLVSFICSFFLGSNKPGDVDPSVLAPFVRRFVAVKDPKNNILYNNPDEKVECITHKFSSE